MIKDVIVSALYMLKMDGDAASVEGLITGGNAVATKFLRYFNLVISEIISEYRDADAAVAITPAYGLYDDVPEIYGVTPRLIAYGIAAEHCITECFDDAVMWDKRYKDALKNSKRKPARVKYRNFI